MAKANPVSITYLDPNACSTNPNAPAIRNQEMGTLLSLSKPATSAALEASEIALLIFGVLLVIGLIGEYRENWKKHLKAFEMCVILGVAGELLADGGVFLFSGHLQTISDLEIAELSKEAGNSRERAAQIEQENIKLNIELAKARREAGQRYFTPEEQDQLFKALSKYAVKRAMIVSRQGDTEAARFGDDFEAVFSRLRWDPGRGWFPPEGMMIDGRTGKRIDLAPPGITIQAVDPSKPPPVARALQRTLKNLDFPFSSTFAKTRETEIADPTKYLKIVIGNREAACGRETAPLPEATIETDAAGRRRGKQKRQGFDPAVYGWNVGPTCRGSLPSSVRLQV